MNKTPSMKNLRRSRGYVSSITINHIHLRNPWVTVWWSAAFPGFGHMIMGSYIKGFFLIIWEVVVNVNAKANLAILYSFTGKFELAKAVLDQRWLLLYVGLFVYAMWDSYRFTVDLNKFTILVERENPPLVPFKINSIEINYFDKRNPWVAVMWSMIIPGLGHLYIHRLLTGLFVLAGWIAASYYSHVLEAVYLTSIGAFGQAAAVVNPQWLMFMPSLYGFALYDAYVNIVEDNKLFELEQAYFLRSEYQDPEFEMPV